MKSEYIYRKTRQMSSILTLSSFIEFDSILFIVKIYEIKN